MDKKQIRMELKLRERSFLESGAAAAESRRILSALEALPEFRNASCILAYMSIPGEVETAEFVEKWSRSRTIVLPRVKGERLELLRYDRNALQEGYRGILEPSDAAEPVDAGRIDFAVIPGLVFAPCPQGGYYRMGRGKGFYDRLLPLLSCPVAALAFPFRLLESIPLDEWDVPVNYLFY